jgi:DNA-directed RNA polymerase specialized sigma24 family protein
MGKAEVRMQYNTASESEGDWLEERVADSFDTTAEGVIENAELGDAIYDCMSKLPKKQAHIFKLKTILGYDTETLCNELDITTSNLWVQIHRARTALATCLEKNWFKA